jgi:hypothetical protein
MLELKSTGSQCQIQGNWILIPRDMPSPICVDRFASNKEKFGWLVNTRTALIPGISGL